MVTGAAGGAVLWIALLWGVAVLIGPLGFPPWATLAGLALVHLGSGAGARSRWLPTRYRWLLAGFAFGLALGRAGR